MKIVAILCFTTLLFAAAAYASGEHPMDMEKTECIICHSNKDVVSKPEVVKEWNQSRHSYTGVGCGNCHGDENNFQEKPLKNACESCHSMQVAETKGNVQCSGCHAVHTFTVHRKMR
ncbi:MAG: cytochrome C [Deferribacteraceae bacterium]|jgi:hypothetical protein|nr:cytochrome C [Deferribacteraceae bacterium]